MTPINENYEGVFDPVFSPARSGRIPYALFFSLIVGPFTENGKKLSGAPSVE
jgi:hypothetical protein